MNNLAKNEANHQESLVALDEQRLIDSWLEQEEKGILFPVDFESAWRIAGYSRKDSAKRYLPKRQEEKLFHVDVVKSTGRPLQRITLSCDGLKHLCLMANNEKGDACRQYFIEAEKKWRLVQQYRPEVAEEIEVLKYKKEIATLEAKKAKYENETLALRKYVTEELPKPISDRILGVTEIKEVEYRDRTFVEEELVNDGNTMSQGELCQHLGFVKNGRNQVSRLKKFFADSGIDTDESFWDKNSSVVTHRQIRRDKLEEIEELHNRSVRQILLGEY